MKSRKNTIPLSIFLLAFAFQMGGPQLQADAIRHAIADSPAVADVPGNRDIPAQAQEPASPESRLAVIWTSADPDVAHRVCFMYTHNAKKQKWFDQVTLIVWGPSARLLAGDKDLQAKIKAMAEEGVKLQACLACADSFGVSEQLRSLGIEVKYMGKPLSEMLQQGWKVLTF